MAQYFDNIDLKSEIRQIRVVIFDQKFVFNSDNGVFCKDKLDYGTRLLLESLPLNEISGKVLDVGCGYGPIGIILSKVTKSEVVMCDINKRALHLARMNAKENRVEVDIRESNCYSNIDDTFDVIITNPPIRAGKEIVYDIVMNARLYMNNNAKLFLVINKDQGAKSLMRDLKEYYEVQVLKKSKGFFTIMCNKR